MEYHITLPSKPRVVSEEDAQGIYEIDALYPGYGHTLGNSLRRIVLSSLPGAAITSIKIEGVPHEFAAIDGVRETVMEMILNLKRVHFVLHGDEPQTITLSVKGPKDVTAADFSCPSQVEITNPDQHIADISGKVALELEATIERGLGYVPREVITKEKVDIGTIALDATFTPVRRVNYEVENMRVGDRTDFNRLRILIETNGTVTPREALERSIETMINQLKSVMGFQEEKAAAETNATGASEDSAGTGEKDSVKVKVEDMNIPTRVATALSEAGIRSAAGLARRTATSLKELEGVGDKAVEEIEIALAELGLSLKGE
ncbi:MAG: DNA-directed RNA polymerase subunit alpha [Parcubacteria group bacterium 21-54-25]|nr:MAG: DNA-directed RNA polymerase subunit alpha [Parcubacteria group bacterium 21-54-25]HQU07820.1 DNA-directed RNA polymerase subunit alpha [Candidatus Paceibacterota bacterium]